MGWSHVIESTECYQQRSDYDTYMSEASSAIIVANLRVLLQAGSMHELAPRCDRSHNYSAFFLITMPVQLKVSPESNEPLVEIEPIRSCFFFCKHVPVRCQGPMCF